MKIDEAKQRRTRELDMALSECILHAQITSSVTLTEVIVVLSDILRRYARHIEDLKKAEKKPKADIEYKLRLLLADSLDALQEIKRTFGGDAGQFAYEEMTKLFERHSEIYGDRNND